MKAIFIVYNQGMTEEVFDALDKMGIMGFTQWTDVRGRGTETGEPHLGTHTWPALNNALICMVEDEKEQGLLEQLKALNNELPQQGIRAFVWNIENSL
ncbi:MAG: PG0541 family transporter-associated protein [Cytophagaceae bacterium]